MNFYNAGIGGTGSDFGITRLYDDVVSRDPDIVFVEFSVNDRAIYNESGQRTLQVRQIPKLYLMQIWVNTFSRQTRTETSI